MMHTVPTTRLQIKAMAGCVDAERVKWLILSYRINLFICGGCVVHWWLNHKAA